MKSMPIPLLGPTTGPEPHQEIAAAVIERALLDATDPHLRHTVRAGALAFLAGSEMFGHWCEVAGLDPALVKGLGRRRLEQGCQVRLQPRTQSSSLRLTASAPRTTTTSAASAPNSVSQIF